MHIFLIGYMGVGKSTIASMLSQKLGLPCAEMDAMIVERQGMPITEIFEKYGEDYFRDIESKLLMEFQEKDSMVVSCGGGVVLRPENAGYMRECGTVVWLTAEPETVFERVKSSKDRPLLNQNMNVDFIRSMMEQRQKKYEAAADLTIMTDDKSIDLITEEILLQLTAIKQQPKKN